MPKERAVGVCVASAEASSVAPIGLLQMRYCRSSIDRCEHPRWGFLFASSSSSNISLGKCGSRFSFVLSCCRCSSGLIMPSRTSKAHARRQNVVTRPCSSKSSVCVPRCCHASIARIARDCLLKVLYLHYLFSGTCTCRATHLVPLCTTHVLNRFISP